MIPKTPYKLAQEKQTKIARGQFVAVGFVIGMLALSVYGYYFKKQFVCYQDKSVCYVATRAQLFGNGFYHFD